MDKKKDLNYFMNLNYSPILKKIRSHYYLFIPELSLISENEDLKNAYERLEEEKVKYFKKIVDLGMQDTVREPVTVVAVKRSANTLFLFFMKTLIIALVCAGIFFCSLSIISGFMNRIIDQGVTGTKNLIMDRLANFYNKVDNMSDRDKEILRLKLRKAVQDIKPYADELSPLWEKEVQEE